MHMTEADRLHQAAKRSRLTLQGIVCGLTGAIEAKRDSLKRTLPGLDLRERLGKVPAIGDKCDAIPMGGYQLDDVGKLRVKRRLSSGESHEADWLVRRYLRQHLVHDRHRQVVVRPVLGPDAVHAAEVTAVSQLENEFDT